MKNIRIRAMILAIVSAGAINTRVLIRQLSQQFSTSKQRIAGNISFLVTSGAVQITRQKPNSYIY